MRAPEGRTPTSANTSAAALLLARGSPQLGDELLWTPLAGRPVAVWSLLSLAALPELGTLIVLLLPLRRQTAERAMLGALPARARARLRLAVSAGEARAAIPAGTRRLVVLEAERPLVAAEHVRAALVALPASGLAVAVAPVTETIKRVAAGIVTETLPRERLARLETPLAIGHTALEAILGSGAPNDGCADAPADALALGALLRRALDLRLPLVTIPAGAGSRAIRDAADLALAETLLRRAP